MRWPYHLVERSPWPILVSLNLLSFLISLVGYMTGYNLSLEFSLFNFIVLLSISLFWFYDIITESLYMGFHTYKATKGLMFGFLLFGLTEVMLFFSLFWAWFNGAWSPFFLIWPPIGIDLVNPWAVPLVNTFLLFYSGIAGTAAHHYFLGNNRKAALNYLFISIILGIIFFLLQVFEYFNTSFDFSDSVYGSAFFITTGCHGLHVIVAVILLIATFIRIYKSHRPDLWFELSMVYAHGVDVIWIALYILIYYLSY